jgi:membrane protein implicated in regulation of membrane protease activity
METVFLVCFIFGALFTVASVVLGLAHTAIGVDTGAPVHTGVGGALAHAHGDASGHGNLPLANVSSLLAFLTWFGAAGFLLLRFGGWPVLVAVAGAGVAGVVGAILIALFMAKVLAGEQVLDPRDYRIEGTIARVTITIPAGGVGEIVFTKAGSRRSEGARSLSGQPIPYGTEVVVVDYDHGVAAVQPWDEFVGRAKPEALERGTPPAGGA